MNYKNAALSVLRHLLTFGGGAVIANNPHLDQNVVQTAIGGILALVGLIWGAKDEHKAENN